MKSETDKNTIVGIMNDYDNSYCISLNDLFKQSKDGDKNHCNSIYTMKEYGDWRFSTDLQRFNFDPFTGKKIDWKIVKNFTGD